MAEGYRLSGRAQSYLEVCAQADTPLREAARRELGSIVSEDAIWSILEENSRHAHIANFSSRRVGNDEQVYCALVALPPAFSKELGERYRRNEQIDRDDVHEAYAQAYQQER